MLKFCFGCRDLDFSEQSDVSKATTSNMFHVFIVKELCLVGFYSKNTGSITFFSKFEEEEYMGVKITL